VKVKKEEWDWKSTTKINKWNILRKGRNKRIMAEKPGTQKIESNIHEKRKKSQCPYVV